MTVSYQIRGTSGSGKTTAARAVMAEMPNLTTLKWGPVDKKGKLTFLERQVGWHPRLGNVSILGSYKNTNGGCDTIHSVKYVAQMLRELMEESSLDLVLFEGLMISHMLGTVGQAQLELGPERCVLAFLDTPLETCLERVQQRRLAAGNTKPFNPANTTKDWPRVHQSARNAILAGYTVTTLDHTRAVECALDQMEALVNGLPIPGHVSSLDQYPVRGF